MKKQVITFLLLMVIGAQMMTHFGYTKVEATDQEVIPDQAIRLRILANSDSDEDQALKREVRDRVKAQIDTWVANLTSIDEARRIIQSHIPELEKTVEQTLREENSKQSFTVEFGKHIKFPTKVYGNFLYPAGEYEAVLVKLGKGEGANWWCVLFPPLCFLDFSSGTAVAQGNVQTAKAAEVTAGDDKTDEAELEEKPQQTVAEQEKENVKKERPKQEEMTVKELKAEVKSEAETEVKSKETQKSTAEEQTFKEKKKDAEEHPTTGKADKEEQSKKIVVKEEEEPKVKFFIVEIFSSLFSK